jgi:hypothetical protein
MKQMNKKKDGKATDQISSSDSIRMVGLWMTYSFFFAFSQKYRKCKCVGSAE